MYKSTRKFVPTSTRLMDQVREVLRFHHYAYNTEKSYISWILQYIHFHNKKTSQGSGEIRGCGIPRPSKEIRVKRDERDEDRGLSLCTNKKNLGAGSGVSRK